MVYPDISSSPSSVASSSSTPRRPTLKSKSKSLSLPPLPHHSHTSPSSPPRATRPFRPFTPLIMPSSSHILSPSKLPSTDAMSYFPPFEDMGSDAPDEEPEAGPSRPASREHGKNRSLGSLAGFMAWATFSPTSEIPPHTTSPSRKEGIVRSTSSGTDGNPPLSDGAKLQALTRRFTHGGGKRRVLEPMPVENDQTRVSLMGLTTVQPKGEGKKQKRRMGSEMEVERLLRRGQVEEHDEEGTVERLVGWTPSREAPSNLPPPPLYLQLPNWRFPIPSPPITSLSPHIPLELFQYEISNPASAGSSPSKMSTSVELELDEIEGALLAGGPDTSLKSGAGSISSGDSDSASALSHPITPPRSRDRNPQLWTPDIKQSYGIRRTPTLDDTSDTDDEEVERLEVLFQPERLKLRRTSSSGSKASCDSNQTLRAKEGDVTPRPGRGYRAVYGI